MDNKDQLFKLAEEKIRETFLKSGNFPTKPEPQKKPAVLVEEKPKTNKTLNEALVVVPRSYVLKTEKLSHHTKQAHESLYKDYVTTFNKTSSKLDTSLRNSDEQSFRSLKVDETYNFNAIKLHELYFSNISDIASEIRTDSVPFIKLTRDWGTFENWQLDFRATCMAAKEGWGVTFFDPYRNVYTNVVIDGHASNIPVGCVPIIVVDMWSHSYYRDYLLDKKAYINGMLKELNWSVVELRMTIAERANLHNLYLVQPVVNSEPERLLAQAESQESAPIGKDQIQGQQISQTTMNNAGQQQTQPQQPTVMTGPGTTLSGV